MLETESIEIVEFDDLPDSAYIRQKPLLKTLPFSSSQLWRMIQSKEFPTPIKFSDRITAWKVGDIRRWLATCQHYTGKNPKRQTRQKSEI